MKHAADHALKRVLARIKLATYLSYRDFLADLLKGLKAELAGFTHKDFSELMGYTRDNNSLRLVISGHRVLKAQTAKSIATKLGLKLAERRYFLAIVDYNNERTQSTRDELFTKLMKLKGEISPKSLDQEQLKYFDQWYNPVIRELLSLPTIDPTPEGIQKALCFPLRLDEIKRSLDLLVELGAIKYDKISGRYEKVNGHIRTDDEVDSLSVTRYHQRMIEMGKDSITRVHEDLRSINAVTVSISRQHIELIKAKINQVLDEVLELEVQGDDPTDVYQMNIQLFPFTNKD